MSYIINRYNGEQLIVLDDGTIDTSTSIGLVGRNYVGYGETQNENFVFLLENFSNDAPPNRPLRGQIWFNTTNNTMYVYDGISWKVIGTAALSDVEPSEPSIGSLWLKTPINTLNVWTGTSWAFIGPEAVPGFGVTRCRSGVLTDTAGIDHPVIYLEINNTIIGVCSADAFVIATTKMIPGIPDHIIAGINLSTAIKINGNITGNAETATRLQNLRLINGIPFDGSANVTIKSSTTNKLVKGTYLTGTDFDGSTETTWTVNATPLNNIGTVVARDASGNFAANTVTANLIGNVEGDVTASGTSRFNVVEATRFIGATLTGNADTATQLATARNINGVSFNGTRDITVSAAASTLTGNTINPTVTTSSLTQVGVLESLRITDSGITIGSDTLQIYNPGDPTIRSLNGLQILTRYGSTDFGFSFKDKDESVALGGDNTVSFIPTGTLNLGHNNSKIDKIYANNLVGNADTATSAVKSTNIANGGIGSIPVQTAANTTGFINLGADGYVLRSRPTGPNWEALSAENLTKGSYVNLINTATSAEVGYFNSAIPVTISVDATSSNAANKVVARDASGNFSATTVTANVTGNVTGNLTGNAGSATKLQTARTINGVPFDGSANITVQATDPSKVPLAGGAMTGYLSLVGTPTAPLHATTKQYVDARLPRYYIVSGASSSTSGYTNQVGSFNYGANFFDVFPPAGFTMANLVAFIPSIHVIYFAGQVNGDDSLMNTYEYLGDRIRVRVQNTEQRGAPAANYLAIWSY